MSKNDDARRVLGRLVELTRDEDLDCGNLSSGAAGDDARRAVAQLLQLTEQEELDCDGFTQNLAAWLEGKAPPSLHTLMDHHRRICPECEEERAILARALAQEET